MNKIPLKEFVEQYIDHNTYVKIYVEKECYYKLIWQGEAWRISDDEFLPVHQHVSRCPYRNATKYELKGDGGMFILLKEELMKDEEC